MNVTLTHPISGFTGNVNVQDGAAVLGFTNGTCSVDLAPTLFNAVSSAGITITIGTPSPAPPYDANYDVVTQAIVSASGSQTTGALRAAYLSPLPTAGSFTYNPDGTIASDPDGNTYTWNTDGTPATQTKGGVTRTFHWNADGTLGSVS